MSATNRASVEIEHIQSLPRSELNARWIEIFGRAPPINTSPDFMMMALTYKLQEKIYGELRPAMRRRLLSINSQTSTATKSTKAGTTLIREWHGVTYSVTVLDKGVQMNGRLYKSLTAVARQITGTHQSGPIFFGLRKHKLPK